MATPGELQNIAAQLRQVAADQDVVTQKTRALLNNINNVWQGGSVNNYINQVQSLMVTDNQKKEMLENIARALLDASKALMECDSSIASAFKN
jgi:uncharacterized protein YukE